MHQGSNRGELNKMEWMIKEEDIASHRASTNFSKDRHYKEAKRSLSHQKITLQLYRWMTRFHCLDQIRNAPSRPLD